MINQDLIKRINELALLSKQRELTEEEKKEREELRKEYLKQFKEGFKQQLENIEIDNNKN